MTKNFFQPTKKSFRRTQNAVMFSTELHPLEGVTVITTETKNQKSSQKTAWSPSKIGKFDANFGKSSLQKKSMLSTGHVYMYSVDHMCTDTTVIIFRLWHPSTMLMSHICGIHNAVT